jgi:two-component system NtrC family sensor kinase
VNESLRLWGAMIASVLLVAMVMFYDEQREFEMALEALRDEQSTLATAVAADFEARLHRSGEREAVPHDPESFTQLVLSLIGGARKLEQPRSRLVLVDDPRTPWFVTASGTRVECDEVRRAIENASPEFTLSRTAAAQLGLPPRLAVAALRRIQDATGTWSVVIIASADRLRARERRAQLRFTLGVVAITALVGGFGGLALRDQRRKLAVARQLEISALQGERERLLAKADKMTTLAALASGIAHQVATPLGIIVARIEQVAPRLEHDPKAEAALSVVAEQVSRIQQVIRGVLSLSRGNRTTNVLARPDAILRSALEAVDHRLQQAGVRVEVDLGQSDGPELQCDPPLLEQALVNLILNACEASHDGDMIEVRVERDAGQLRFVILDNGEGIREDIASGAREPFFSTKPAGAGVGLAIASEIAAHHGGELILERRGPKGTRAVIALPG